MIRALVERLPVMVCPRWVATLTQPIAIDDVLAYLAAAVDLEGDGNRIFDIGGPEVVSYGDMMREYARQRGLRRLLLPVPLLTPHLSGLWLALVTPAQARVGRALVESLKNPTIVRSNAAHATFNIEPRPLATALRRRSTRGRSRVKQDYARHRGGCASLAGICSCPLHRRHERVVFRRPPVAARAGGYLDRRRRHEPRTSRRRMLCDGDVIDGWTVDAYEPDKRLR